MEGEKPGDPEWDLMKLKLWLLPCRILLLVEKKGKQVTMLVSVIYSNYQVFLLYNKGNKYIVWNWRGSEGSYQFFMSSGRSESENSVHTTWQGQGNPELRIIIAESLGAPVARLLIPSELFIEDEIQLAGVVEDGDDEYLRLLFVKSF